MQRRHPRRPVHLRHSVVLRVAAILLALLLISVSGSVASAFNVHTTGIGLIKLGDGLRSSSSSVQLTRYSVIIVGQSGAQRAARLPGRSLLYTCGVNIPDGAWSSTCGVSWTAAVTHGWLLRDGGGNYVPYGDGVSYLADVGNPDYQRAWIASVRSILASDRGMDGVMIDNVAGSLITPSAKYPDNASYRQAMKSFLDALGPALHARGWYVAVNASMNDDVTANWLTLYGNTCDGSQVMWWYRQLAPDVNGFVTESWEMNWDSSGSIRLTGVTECNENWDGWQRLVAAVQAIGKDFIPVTSGTADAAGVSKSTYLRASFLLDYNGGTSAFIYSAGGVGGYAAPNDDGIGGAAWTLDVGRPIGKKYRVGVGWRREFARGVVVIDPHPGSPQRFGLKGAYLLPDRTSPASVTLSPGTALILPRRSGVPRPHHGRHRRCGPASPPASRC
jgi:hypothetical protein